MKRLLGLLLVMGGCYSNTTDITAPDTVAVKSSTAVHIEDVKTVDSAKTEERSGLLYLINSETPFTGIVVGKYQNGQKEWGSNYKNGKPDGPYIEWYDNGQKRREGTSKDGKPLTGKHWDEEGNEIKK